MDFVSGSCLSAWYQHLTFVSNLAEPSGTGSRNHRPYVNRGARPRTREVVSSCKQRAPVSGYPLKEQINYFRDGVPANERIRQSSSGRRSAEASSLIRFVGLS